ncbi:hypothetical protein [Aureliella helgolandensis]|uniref:YrhK domain-containing protein n=1 Tax=Aureliella helgolandensis TaxID=2527968 RepID=A0A518G9C0_9BACT|nr:hypothetical protein [Aureliella helgolandensis]QDV25187.1 hypothetical protein Q31a_35100 [Aureliella helgolandensis]
MTPTVRTPRHLRKSLGSHRLGTVLSPLWKPENLNWWIGCIFAIGSLLFAVASLLTLLPALAAACSLQPYINAIFFSGSIPFTLAAWLQLYQAANAHPQVGTTRKWFGWRPQDVGWRSCALQFAGTLLFNINTYDAMLPSLSWMQQDLAVWTPDVIGSILFLSSGYLAFVEVNQGQSWFQPRQLSWWVVFANLLGCIGFMISAVYAIALPEAHEAWSTISIGLTLVGAIFFLLGSLLMLEEAIKSELPSERELGRLPETAEL